MKKYILLCSIPVISFGALLYSYMDHRPLVSVVMPTYNRIHLLPRSIESILNQTYDKFEFIIVDDASTDGSNNLLESYAKLDPRIRILTNETNKGISYSRNKGTDAAKGKYVAIMDSDDFSLPTRFEKHVEYLEKHDDVIALNALYLEMGKEKNGLNNWVPPHRFEVIFHLKNYYTNIAFFRTDFIRKHKIRYDETRLSSEDYDFWSKIFLKGGKLHMLNEHLIDLRRHRTNSREYYDQIKTNSRKTSDKLLAAMGVAEPEKLKTDCERLNAMTKANQLSHRVDQYTLELIYNRQCQGGKIPANGYQIKHIDFVDYFEPTQTKHIFKRMRNNDKYTFMGMHGDLYAFKNPKGEIELYNKQFEKTLALKEIQKNENSFLKNLLEKIKSFF
ncbi:MAG: glycosyltransferase family 2 protein [Alphaproteobacteria bacterium]|nr:glycosyltransferase family 2 protein [Alphaproteobacteria bacterium]